MRKKYLQKILKILLVLGFWGTVPMWTPRQDCLNAAGCVEPPPSSSFQTAHVDNYKSYDNGNCHDERTEATLSDSVHSLIVLPRGFYMRFTNDDHHIDRILQYHNDFRIDASGLTVSWNTHTCFNDKDPDDNYWWAHFVTVLAW